MPGRVILSIVIVVAAAATAGFGPTTSEPASDPADTTPIQHVVVLFQENHSFDNVLGRFCSLADSGVIDRAHCAGATEGRLPNGHLVPLTPSPDLVTGVLHDPTSQRTAINGGKMNGFAKIPNCWHLDCYQQFTANHGTCGPHQNESCIRNLVTLATKFALSDHTFEFRRSPSFGGHMAIITPSLDRFAGTEPDPSTFTKKTGPGWGCDSYRDEPWFNGTTHVKVPSCVPDSDGNGPYRPSPVLHIPTLLDLLDIGAESWKIYGAQGYAGRAALKSGYLWSVCPTFYSCIGHHSDRLVPAGDVLSDATNGDLPAYSLVTPVVFQSQHNYESMGVGDTWIGDVVQAIETGPDWDSTAIFITYDDCGCFYDHMNPMQYRANWGIRVPLVIVSPYAKPGFTDTHPATFASIIAFTEHVFSLPPLATCKILPSPTCDDDSTAYDYMDAFDFNQTPLPPARMTKTVIPDWEWATIRAHPILDDGT